MTNIVYRVNANPPTPVVTSTKNAPLTNLEIDGNFKSLSNDIDTKLSKAGDTALGKLNFAAATTGFASTRYQIGVDPSAPLDGDLWSTTGGLRYRFGNITKTLSYSESPIFTGIASFESLTASVDSAFTSFGALTIPVGSTAQRPVGANGKIRYNTTTNSYEGYKNGTVWSSLGGITYTVRTSAYTAISGDGIIANTTAAAFSITLPINPISGDYVLIVDGANFAVNNLTILRNGSTIEGVADDLVLNIGGVSVELVYSGSTWQVYTQIGGQTGDVVTTTATQTLSNKTLSAPVLTNAVLGTPSSGTLTNCTGLPVTTGITGFGVGVSNFLSTPSSSNLLNAVTDETGTGSLVFNTSPSLITPTVTGTSSNVTGSYGFDNLYQSPTYYDGTAVQTVGYRNIPQNIKNENYTLVATDSGKHIFHATADTTARTYTIPANSSVAYPIGTALTFINQNGAGVVTISINTDTMRLGGSGEVGNRTLLANGIATAIKVSNTEWIISGTGLI